MITFCPLSSKTIRYDDISFVAMEDFAVLFPGVESDKEKWVKKYSVLVDCLYEYMALHNGVGVMIVCFPEND